MSYHFTLKVDSINLNKVYMIPIDIITIILIPTSHKSIISEAKEEKDRKAGQEKDKMIKQEN